MRVLLVILALAYWGLALLAQSYLMQGFDNPVSTSAEFSFEESAPDAELAACEEAGENDLLVAASYSSNTASLEDRAAC